MTPFFLFAGLFASQGGGTTLTIDDALRLADQNAFEILLQQAAVEKQRQALNQAKGTLGPTVSVNGTYTRFDQESTASLGPGQPSFVISPIETRTASATASLPIDITGNLRRLIRASKANLLAQRETLEANRNTTRQAVRTAYLAVLRAESQAKIAQEAIASETENVRTTQVQFDQGTAAKLDVLTAKTQLAQSQTDLITAQNAVEIAKEALNNTLARKIDTPVEVVDPTEPTPPSADSVAELEQVAQKLRPEAKALLKTRDALREIRRATEQGTLPSLSVGVTYERNLGEVAFGSRPELTTGVLSLNWPLYDSGQTRARVKEARQDEETARIQYEQLELGISLDVRQAFANLTNARAKLDVANQQVESGREALRLAKLKLAQGEGIYLEVLNAQSSLTQAEQGQASARYDFLQAVADLQHAVGSDTFGGGTK